MRIGIMSWIAFLIWAASEVAIVIRARLIKHKAPTARSLDRGSYWFVLIAIYVAIGIAFLFHSQEWGWVNSSIANIGVLLMLAGVALRLWSIQVLGRGFSALVSIDPNQTLVKNGPYKFIRHPAYTGSLLTFSFLGLALNSWMASCIILLTLLAAFIYRIHVEERALLSHFHSAYHEYSRNTWRLIPYLW